jgi:hypothetical protein
VTGTVGDVNGDGVPDIVLAIANENGEDLQVYLGTGKGAFKQLSPQPQSQAVAWMIAAPYFRGTSTVDLMKVTLIAGTETFSLTACAGNGNGTFQSGVNVAFPSGLMPWLAVIAGDWNGAQIGYDWITFLCHDLAG